MQRQRLRLEEERDGEGEGERGLAGKTECVLNYQFSFARGGAPCRGRSCGTCRDRSCGRDSVPRHVHWSRPQGNGLSCQISSLGQTASNIAVSIGCAPTEPRRDVPAARHRSRLGLGNHGHWLQRERGQPRKGSALKICLSASAPTMAAVTAYHTSHSRSTASSTATTCSWKHVSAA